MPKVVSHHWHIVVDENNRATPASVEHEHLVNRGRRHAHYHEYDTVVAGALELGKSITEARLLGMKLDGTVATTNSFDQEPRPQAPLEQDVARSLHPEVRKSLS